MEKPISRVSFLLTGLLFLNACTPHYVFESIKKELGQIQSGHSANHPTVSPPVPYQDLRGAIHVHSHLSHDSRGTDQEILSAAREAGLSFIVMTDHDSPRIFQEGLHGLHEGVWVIRGMEMSQGGCQAHPCASLLAIGLSSYIDSRSLTLRQVVEEVQRQGGLTFVAHPKEWDKWDGNGITGMEIYDILDDALDKKWLLPKLFFDIFYSHRDYLDEIFLEIQDYPASHLAKWDQQLQFKKLVGIAGNDAHQNVKILGRQVDPYAMSFRFVTTHLLATALSEPAILSALAEGRAYVAFDLLANPTGFLFTASSSHGQQTMMGETAALAHRQTLIIQSPIDGEIVLIKDGRSIRECTCRQLSLLIDHPGVYRAEVFLRVQGRLRPWILSNPIYIQ